VSVDLVFLMIGARAWNCVHGLAQRTRGTRSSKSHRPGGLFPGGRTISGRDGRICGLRWRRDDSGRRRLLRTYTFDYTSDGFERARGSSYCRAHAWKRRIGRKSFVNAGGIVDLHTHSTCSDGALPPAELVERAAAAGIALLALTDHDTTAGLHSRGGRGPSGSDIRSRVEVSVAWRIRRFTFSSLDRS